jgi:hypothetical protein
MRRGRRKLVPRPGAGVTPFEVRDLCTASEPAVKSLLAVVSSLFVDVHQIGIVSTKSRT